MADDKDEVAPSPDVFFEPVVVLPEVQTQTLEEDEEELLKMRGKLYRFATTEDPHEWKERGLGEVKILKHKISKSCRILMRRDKTLKICANHKILPWMELKPNCGSDKAWVWNTPADFADEEPKVELLALRFGSAENAKKFKEVFDDCRDVATVEYEHGDSEDDTESEDEEEEESKDAQDDEVTEKLRDLQVKDDVNTKGDEKPKDKESEETKEETK